MNGENDDRLRVSEAEVPRNLVFDDEPIQAVLYGAPEDEPSVVSVFEHVRKLVTELSGGAHPDPESALRAILGFLDEDRAILPECFRSLVGYARSFLPHWPAQPSPEMPPSAGVVLERLWQRAEHAADDELRSCAGMPLWEWYEMTRCHARAREVLQALVDIAERSHNPQEMRGLLNNLAFQYWLERQWAHAARHFARAADLAKEHGDLPGYAQFKANYWACRFEEDGLADADLMHAELEQFAEILRTGGRRPAERKALVYLAKVEQAQGKLEDAVAHARRAVAIDESQQSIYLSHDRKLLEELQVRENLHATGDVRETGPPSTRPGKAAGAETADHP